MNPKPDYTRLRAPEVGDRVRSYDFVESARHYGFPLEGEHACYVEGVIEKIAPFEGCAPSCDHYHIRTERRVFSGFEETRFAEFYFPPTDSEGVRIIEPAWLRRASGEED